MMTSGQQPVSVQSAPCQPPVYVVSTGTTTGRRENFAAKTGMLLGKSQVVLGSLSFILNVVSMVFHDYQSYMGLGIICGTLAITAGGLGIGAAKKKTTCLIVGFMVLSILAAVAAGFLIMNSSFGLRHMRYFYYYGNAKYNLHLALKILTIIISLLVVVCGTWASVLGCKVTCCYTPPPETFQAVYQGGTAAPVVMIQATTALPGRDNQTAPPPQYTPNMATTAPPNENKDGYNKL